MKQNTTPIRFAATLAIMAFASSAAITSAQDEASAAADAAEQVAQEVQSEIRRIDPTTGGDSLVGDPSLPTPFGSDTLPDEQPEISAPALPPLTVQPAVEPALEPEVASVPAATIAPPRGPAARTIAQQVVQETPAYDVNDPFVIKSILPIEGALRYGEWHWDESNAPKTGKLVMTVDLDARVISVFRDGHEIGTAVALLGTQKHPTPLGTFPILTKEKDNISEKYNNAPMPWTLRLTWDGIAIHGSPVLNGYASHGCIGVPDPFAEKLFDIAKRGDRVVITRGSMVGIGDKVAT